MVPGNNCHSRDPNCATLLASHDPRQTDQLSSRYDPDLNRPLDLTRGNRTHNGVLAFGTSRKLHSKGGRRKRRGIGGGSKQQALHWEQCSWWGASFPFSSSSGLPTWKLSGQRRGNLASYCATLAMNCAHEAHKRRLFLKAILIWDRFRPFWYSIIVYWFPICNCLLSLLFLFKSKSNFGKSFINQFDFGADSIDNAARNSFFFLEHTSW